VPVRDSVAKNFKGYGIVETQTLQRWNEQTIVYELHLDNPKEVIKTQFSVAGAILSRSSKPKS
jgi:hypothetical protein